MQTKEIEINGKKFIVHELLAIEEDEIIDMNLEKLSQKLKAKVMKSTDMKEEEYQVLTSMEREKILEAINELNHYNETFQKSEITESKN